MKSLLVDYEKCVSCHTCELACAVAHSRAGSLTGAALSGEKPEIRIHVLESGNVKFPLQCRHCSDAPCIKSCISGALYREEKTRAVLCDVTKCIGCWMCVMACPFGAVTAGRTHTALKCDLCISTGKTPACAYACPTQAIRWGEPADFTESRQINFIVNYLNGGGVQS